MDWIIIIVLFSAFAFIFILVAIALSRDENATHSDGNSRNKPFIDSKNKSILQIEFPRHKQILEESIQLIQDTRNLETLLSRYDIAMEHYNWIMEQKAKGMPIWFDTEEGGFENALNKINNYHIVRIAMDKFINYKKKMYGLKTPKAKENNTAQMFEFLEKCKQSLKPHLNKVEFEGELSRLYNNTEDFYSDNAN